MQEPDNTLAADSSTSLMPRSEPQKSPSRAVRIGCLVLSIAITAWTAYNSVLALLILPIVLAPTMWLFYYNSHMPQARQVDPDRLYWSYLGTAFPGTPLVTLVQIALLIPFASLVFGSQKDFFWHEFETVHKESDIRDDAHRAARAEFTATWAYWMFAVFLSFIDAAATEELLKYSMIIFAKRNQQYVREMDLIMYGAASGLSFATLEGLGYIVPECRTGNTGMFFMTLFERMALGMPLHVICGMLTAVNVARRSLTEERLNLLRIVGPAIFFHGMMNFVLLGYCAWAGIVGWIHPEHIGTLSFLLIAVGLVIIAAAFTLRSNMAKLGLSI